MYYDMNTIIEDELASINYMIEMLEKYDYGILNGSLNIKRSSRSIKYYYRPRTPKGQKRLSLSLGDDRGADVIALKQARYNYDLLNKLKKNKRVLEKIAGQYEAYDMDAIDEGMSPIYRDNTGLVNKDPVFMRLKEWSAGPYRKNGITISKDSNIAGDGTRVRSKSEVIIYDCLKFYDVPFHYDADVDLRNEMGQKVYKNADFVIKRRDAEDSSGPKYILLEHLGRLDDDVYFENNMHKIRLYVRNGYRLNDTLFITSDDRDGHINGKSIVDLIKNSILPKVRA